MAKVLKLSNKNLINVVGADMKPYISILSWLKSLPIEYHNEAVSDAVGDAVDDAVIIAPIVAVSVAPSIADDDCRSDCSSEHRRNKLATRLLNLQGL